MTDGEKRTASVIDGAVRETALSLAAGHAVITIVAARLPLFPLRFPTDSSGP